MTPEPSAPTGLRRASALRWRSDERLARLSAAGDEAAFGVLYERHHQALYRYCRSIVRDEHDAQDALQGAMASALAGAGTWRPGVPVRAWLFRIAHNEAVSLLRRRRRVAALDEAPEPASASAGEPGARAPTPGDAGRRPAGSSRAPARGARHARAERTSDTRRSRRRCRRRRPPRSKRSSRPASRWRSSARGDRWTVTRCAKPSRTAIAASCAAAGSAPICATARCSRFQAAIPPVAPSWPHWPRHFRRPGRRRSPCAARRRRAGNRWDRRAGGEHADRGKVAVGGIVLAAAAGTTERVVRPATPARPAHTAIASAPPQTAAPAVVSGSAPAPPLTRSPADGSSSATRSATSSPKNAKAKNAKAKKAKPKRRAAARRASTAAPAAKANGRIDLGAGLAPRGARGGKAGDACRAAAAGEPPARHGRRAAPRRKATPEPKAPRPAGDPPRPPAAATEKPGQSRRTR